MCFYNELGVVGQLQVGLEPHLEQDDKLAATMGLLTF